MITKKVMPTDYDQLLHLTDIAHWNRLTKSIAEYNIKEFGFYSCMLGNKKTVIIP